MRKHIIPFYLEAPTQELTTSGAHSWNGRASKITTTAGAADTELSIDASATEGVIKPGTLLVVEQNAGTITNSAVVNINYGGSAVFTLDAASESVTFIFFDDRDSTDDATWEVLSKDASTGNLSATALTLSGAFIANGNVALGNAATDTVGFYGTTAVIQQTGAAQLTDSTGGTASATDTLVAITDTTSDVSALINNNLATLAREVEVLRAKLIAYGLLG